MTKTYGNFTDFIDFSRASSGTYLGSDGLLKTAADNVPRVEYDSSGVLKGLLIEEQRTNLVTYSEELSNGAWTLSGTSVSLSGLSPFGIPSYFVEETGASERGIYHGHTYSAAEHTLWCIAKSGTSDYLQVRFPIVNRNAIFDLSDGSVVSVPASSTAGTRGLGNGYWLCWHTTTTTAGASSAALYTKNGDVEIVCAQLEQGSFPTSYIPTSGATATRSADIADIATANFGYNPKAGTIVVEFNVANWANDTSANYSGIWEFYGNIGSNADGVFRGVATGAVRYRFNEDDSTTAALGAAELDIPSDTGFDKVAVGLKSGSNYIIMNGGTSATGTGTAATNLYSTLQIGQRASGGNYINGHIKSIKYRPRRNSNTQLQEFTS